MKLKRRTFAALTALATVAASLAVVAPSAQAAERIKVDGSSTVAPITSAVAQVFRSYRRAAQKDNAPVTVGISGTGGGFQKFCTNDANVRTDISDASRPIKESEAQACAAAGVEYIEIKVAIDALTIGVHPSNDAVSDITFEELTAMWREDSTVTKWSDVRSEWPDLDIEFFRPGDNSGTFDYFAELILDDINVRRTTSTNRVTPSEDDNTLVEGISGNPAAIGFFGFAYYQNNRDKIKSLGVAEAAGETPVRPSPEAVNAGTYPFSRPLFIYVNKEAYESREEVRDFVAFYLSLLMKDAGGTPSGVDSAITNFLNTSNAPGVELARDGGFLAQVGYVSKPVSEYVTEMAKL